MKIWIRHTLLLTYRYMNTHQHITMAWPPKTSCKRAHACLRSLLQSVQTPCRDRASRQMVMFWPLGSKSVLLKGCGTLNSPPLVPLMSATAKRALWSKSILILANMWSVVTACFLFDKDIFETGSMASSVVINAMLSILCSAKLFCSLRLLSPKDYF